MDTQNYAQNNEDVKVLIVENYKEFLKIARICLKGRLSYLAEDAAQTSILKALNKAHLFRGDANRFRTWMFTLVKNTCTDIARKKREEFSPEGDLSAYGEISFAEEESAQEKRAQLKALRKAIYELNEKDRKLVLLKDYYKCSGNEIGGYLEMSPAIVTTYYYRAKMKLSMIINKSVF